MSPSKRKKPKREDATKDVLARCGQVLRQLFPKSAYQFEQAVGTSPAGGLSHRPARELWKGHGASMPSGQTLYKLATRLTPGINPAYLLLGGRGGSPVLGETAPAVHDAAEAFADRIRQDLQRDFDEGLVERALPSAAWLYATQLAHARQTVEQHRQMERHTHRQWSRRKVERHTTTHGPTVTIGMIELLDAEYGTGGTP